MATFATGRRAVGVLTARGSAPRALGLTLAVAAVGAIVGVLPAYRPGLFWLLTGLTAAALLAFLTVLRPGAALVTLVALAQVYPVVLAELVRLGVPLSSALAGSFWKEVLGLTLGALVVARGPSRWRAVDFLVAAYLAVLLLYALGPWVSLQLMASPRLVDPAAILQRGLVAAREDGMLLVLFLAGRHLVGSGRTFERLETVILVSGLLFALIGIWNVVDPVGWSGWQGHLTDSLGGFRPALVNYDLSLGRVFVRAGSVFQSYIALAYFLVIPIGLVIARVTHGRARPWHLVTLVLCSASLALTLTRSALFAVAVMTGVALLAGRRRGALVTSAIVGALLLIPLAETIGLGRRLGQAFDLSDPGTAGHVDRVFQSVRIMLQHPLGQGLATAGDLSARFLAPSRVFYNESWYFQIGTEMGWAGFILFILALGFILRELWRRAREGSLQALGALCALTGLATGGLVLHTFQDPPVAWAGMVLAGLACGFREDQPVRLRSAPAHQSLRQGKGERRIA